MQDGGNDDGNESSHSFETVESGARTRSCTRQSGQNAGRGGARGNVPRSGARRGRGSTRGRPARGRGRGGAARGARGNQANPPPPRSPARSNQSPDGNRSIG